MVPHAHPVGAPAPAGGRRRRRRLIAAVLLTIAGGAAIAVWAARRERTPALEPRWSAQVRLLAGDGTTGVRDGDALRAQFADPFGVAVAADGTIFVADGGDSPRIRMLSPDGRVSTLAGGARGFADGQGSSARFDTPSAIAIDATGTLYVADTGNDAIRRVQRDGLVTTIAGGGGAGFRDGPASEAQFNGPVGLTLDAAGRLVVADTYNDRIRVIEVDGRVRTLAGSGVPGGIDGPPAAAQFDTPCGVAVDGLGRVHVADTGNGLIRLIEADGTVSTRALDLPAGFDRPLGVAITGDRLLTTDARGRVIEAFADGTTRIVAGSSPGFADGTGDEARFRAPAGLAVVGPGAVVVADAGNAVVRLVAAASRLGLYAPAPARVAPAFDRERFATTPLLWPVSPMDGPHEVAGTLGEARGGEGSERLHAGIDVRDDDGTPVVAVRDGTVTSPIATDDFGSLNEWLRIGPVAYVHIRAGRERDNSVLDLRRFVPTYDETGTLARIRVKRGARFTLGEPIGSVNRFNHVHLNVGWPGEEINPLDFDLMQFTDTVAPVIARGGVRLFDDRGQELKRRVRGRVEVSGRIRIVVDAWDQVDGNRPNRRLGLYDLGYQILQRDGSPAPGFEQVRQTLRFDRLAIDSEAARLAYAAGSGIPFYGGRRTRFLYVVTNTLRQGVATEGYWDTSQLLPGDYIVRAHAADIRGNVATGNRDVPVRVIAPPGP